MNILYIGDVMGEAGIETVLAVLPELEKEYELDFVIAQSENVSEGRGMSPEDMKTLQHSGVDFFTGGNWSLAKQEVLKGDLPVIRPANYPDGTPGAGYKLIQTTATGSVLVISLLGSIVGKDADKPVDNPLRTIDKILEAHQDIERAATVVNFHGDFSSEKRIIGYYLDGRVTAVVGDHWHVPTADASVLPKGTAHITDVGMCGSLHSSLGVEFESVIPRWRDGKVTRNVLASQKPYQFNAILVETNNQTGLAQSIQQIQTTVN